MSNVDRVGKGPFGPRLETWLNRMIHQGALKALPRYEPVRGRGKECPENYARDLLESLTSAGNDARTLEQIKDDGRAFRSWAETAHAHGPRSGGLARGFSGQAG